MVESSSNYKFLFGDRLVDIHLHLLEHLIAAYYGKDKIPHLRVANTQLEKLRHLMRMCTQMKWLAPSQLEFATRELNAIGSLVGGWMRQQVLQPAYSSSNAPADSA